MKNKKMYDILLVPWELHSRGILVELSMYASYANLFVVK
jgi:hypothetical protein